MAVFQLGSFFFTTIKKSRNQTFYGYFPFFVKCFLSVLNEFSTHPSGLFTTYVKFL